MFLAIGLTSGKIVLYKPELLFSKVSIATFYQHDSQISDLHFNKRSEHLHLLFSISRGGTLAVMSLNQDICLFKTNIDQAKLKQIIELPDKDSILINQSVSLDVFRVDFNYFQMAPRVRKCSFKYKILHHSLTTKD